MKTINTATLETLTVDNMHKAQTIICIGHPEISAKKFNQDHSADKFHSRGVGSNSAVLFEREFHFWAIASYK
jgi:hypothetical protein